MEDKNKILAEQTEAEVVKEIATENLAKVTGGVKPAGDDGADTQADASASSRRFG